MITLKPVVLVRELPPMMARMRSYLPSLSEFVRDAASPFEAEIIDYLSRGKGCCVFSDRGLARDVLDPHRADAELQRLAGVDLTDGTWIWPSVLPYYVKRYHIRLPESFVEFAQRNRWEIDHSAIDLSLLSVDALYAVREDATAGRS